MTQTALAFDLGGTDLRAALVTRDGAVLTLTIDAAKTAGFTWHTGVYDIEVELNGEVRTIIATSAVEVLGEVTT